MSVDDDDEPGSQHYRVASLEAQMVAERARDAADDPRRTIHDQEARQLQLRVGAGVVHALLAVSDTLRDAFRHVRLPQSHHVGSARTAEDYARDVGHPLADVPQYVLDAARVATEEAVVTGDVDAQHAHPLADAVLAKALPALCRWFGEESATVRRVLAVRELELMTARGPCMNSECRLHFGHGGPCDVRRLPGTAGHGEDVVGS